MEFSVVSETKKRFLVGPVEGKKDGEDEGVWKISSIGGPKICGLSPSDSIRSKKISNLLGSFGGSFFFHNVSQFDFKGGFFACVPSSCEFIVSGSGSSGKCIHNVCLLLSFLSLNYLVGQNVDYYEAMSKSLEIGSDISSSYSTDGIATEEAVKSFPLLSQCQSHVFHFYSSTEKLVHVIGDKIWDKFLLTFKGDSLKGYTVGITHENDKFTYFDPHGIDIDGVKSGAFVLECQHVDDIIDFVHFNSSLHGGDIIEVRCFGNRIVRSDLPQNVIVSSDREWDLWRKGFMKDNSSDASVCVSDDGVVISMRGDRVCKCEDVSKNNSKKQKNKKNVFIQGLLLCTFVCMLLFMMFLVSFSTSRYESPGESCVRNCCNSSFYLGILGDNTSLICSSHGSCEMNHFDYGYAHDDIVIVSSHLNRETVLSVLSDICVCIIHFLVVMFVVFSHFIHSSDGVWKFFRCCYVFMLVTPLCCSITLCFFVNHGVLVTMFLLLTLCYLCFVFLFMNTSVICSCFVALRGHRFHILFFVMSVTMIILEVLFRLCFSGSFYVSMLSLLSVLVIFSMIFMDLIFTFLGSSKNGTCGNRKWLFSPQKQPRCAKFDDFGFENQKNDDDDESFIWESESDNEIKLNRNHFIRSFEKLLYGEVNNYQKMRKSRPLIWNHLIMFRNRMRRMSYRVFYENRFSCDPIFYTQFFDKIQKSCHFLRKEISVKYSNSSLDVFGLVFLDEAIQRVCHSLLNDVSISSSVDMYDNSTKDDYWTLKYFSRFNEIFSSRFVQVPNVCKTVGFFLRHFGFDLEDIPPNLAFVHLGRVIPLEKLDEVIIRSGDCVTVLDTIWRSGMKRRRGTEEDEKSWENAVFVQIKQKYKKEVSYLQSLGKYTQSDIVNIILRVGAENIYVKNRKDRLTKQIGKFLEKFDQEKEAEKSGEEKSPKRPKKNICPGAWLDLEDCKIDVITPHYKEIPDGYGKWGNFAWYESVGSAESVGSGRSGVLKKLKRCDEDDRRVRDEDEDEEEEETEPIQTFSYRIHDMMCQKNALLHTECQRGWCDECEEKRKRIVRRTKDIVKKYITENNAKEESLKLLLGKSNRKFFPDGLRKLILANHDFDDIYQSSMYYNVDATKMGPNWNFEISIPNDGTNTQVLISPKRVTVSSTIKEEEAEILEGIRQFLQRINDLYSSEAIDHCMRRFKTHESFFTILDVRDFLEMKLTLGLTVSQWNRGVRHYGFPSYKRINKEHNELLTILCNSDVLRTLGKKGIIMSILDGLISKIDKGKFLEITKKCIDNYCFLHDRINKEVNGDDNKKRLKELSLRRFELKDGNLHQTSLFSIGFDATNLKNFFKKVVFKNKSPSKADIGIGALIDTLQPLELQNLIPFVVHMGEMKYWDWKSVHPGLLKEIRRIKQALFRSKLNPSEISELQKLLRSRKSTLGIDESAINSLKTASIRFCPVFCCDLLGGKLFVNQKGWSDIWDYRTIFKSYDRYEIFEGDLVDDVFGRLPLATYNLFVLLGEGNTDCYRNGLFNLRGFFDIIVARDIMTKLDSVVEKRWCYLHFIGSNLRFYSKLIVDHINYFGLLAFPSAVKIGNLARKNEFVKKMKSYLDKKNLRGKDNEDMKYAHYKKLYHHSFLVNLKKEMEKILVGLDYDGTNRTELNNARIEFEKQIKIIANLCKLLGDVHTPMRKTQIQDFCNAVDEFLGVVAANYRFLNSIPYYVIISVLLVALDLVLDRDKVIRQDSKENANKPVIKQHPKTNQNLRSWGLRKIFMRKFDGDESESKSTSMNEHLIEELQSKNNEKTDGADDDDFVFVDDGEESDGEEEEEEVHPKKHNGPSNPQKSDYLKVNNFQNCSLQHLIHLMFVTSPSNNVFKRKKSTGQFDVYVEEMKNENIITSQKWSNYITVDKSPIRDDKKIRDPVYNSFVQKLENDFIRMKQWAEAKEKVELENQTETLDHRKLNDDQRGKDTALLALHEELHRYLKNFQVEPRHVLYESFIKKENHVVAGACSSGKTLLGVLNSIEISHSNDKMCLMFVTTNDGTKSYNIFMKKFLKKWNLRKVKVLRIGSYIGKKNLKAFNASRRKIIIISHTRVINLVDKMTNNVDETLMKHLKKMCMSIQRIFVDEFHEIFKDSTSSTYKAFFWLFRFCNCLKPLEFDQLSEQYYQRRMAEENVLKQKILNRERRAKKKMIDEDSEEEEDGDSRKIEDVILKRVVVPKHLLDKHTNKVYKCSVVGFSATPYDCVSDSLWNIFCFFSYNSKEDYEVLKSKLKIIEDFMKEDERRKFEDVYTLDDTVEDINTILDKWKNISIIRSDEIIIDCEDPDIFVVMLKLSQKQKTTYDSLLEEILKDCDSSLQQNEKIKRKRMTIARQQFKATTDCNILEKEQYLKTCKKKKVKVDLSKLKEINLKHNPNLEFYLAIAMIQEKMKKKMLTCSEFLSVLANTKLYLRREIMKSNLDSVHQQNLENVMNRLFSMTGKEDVEERSQIIKAFEEVGIEVPKAAFLQMSAGIGTLGHNLQMVDFVFQFACLWNPATQYQLSKRFHRLGRTKKLTYLQCISQSTTEEGIFWRNLYLKYLMKRILYGHEFKKVTKEDCSVTSRDFIQSLTTNSDSSAGKYVRKLKTVTDNYVAGIYDLNKFFQQLELGESNMW